jgi:arylsulfatase A-like enzyme
MWARMRPANATATATPPLSPPLSLALSLFLALGCSHGPAPAVAPAPAASRARVIVFVWDGLRPDAITRAETPNLHALREEGVDFTDHHSTYPTFTMVNAASLATGSRPGRHGFFGNNLYVPGPDGKSTDGKDVRFSREVVFTEDLGTLRSLDRNLGGKLFLAPTLFEAAQAAGLLTAAVGKAGPAALMDLKGKGMLVDESAVVPEELARAVQGASEVKWPLARNATDPLKLLADGVTPDPSAPTSRHARANRALMAAYLDHVLPRRPDLSVIWLRDPDSTEHAYGPGAPAYHDALARMDALLGDLRARLAREGLGASTDIVIMSDHGHTTISGPPADGAVPSSDGPFAPGEVRMAAILAAAGIAAYDSLGCILSPLLSPYGVHEDAARCPGPFSTPSFKIPEKLAPGAAIVAANGGSDYVYVPDGDRAAVARVVRALQARPEVAALFVAAAHGDLPGTLALAVLGLEDGGRRRPDIVVAYAGDETARVRCLAGVEYAGSTASRYRGMHGAFSPSDVHATLVAAGPHFRRRFRDPLPSGNVDVAPTLAALLGIALPGAEGRPLLEALAAGGAATTDYAIEVQTLRPARAATVEAAAGAAAPPFTFELRRKLLRGAGREAVYDDEARRVVP